MPGLWLSAFDGAVTDSRFVWWRLRHTQVSLWGLNSSFSPLPRDAAALLQKELWPQAVSFPNGSVQGHRGSGTSPGLRTALNACNDSSTCSTRWGRCSFVKHLLFLPDPAGLTPSHVWLAGGRLTKSLAHGSLAQPLFGRETDRIRLLPTWLGTNLIQVVLIVERCFLHQLLDS